MVKPSLKNFDLAHEFHDYFVIMLIKNSILCKTFQSACDHAHDKLVNCTIMIMAFRILFVFPLYFAIMIANSSRNRTIIPMSSRMIFK